MSAWTRLMNTRKRTGYCNTANGECVPIAEVLPRPSGTIDPAADRGFFEHFAIHLLGLDLLGGRVHELVVLPERRLPARQLESLSHEQLAVRVLEVNYDFSDQVFSLAVGENLAIEIENGDVEIAIVEATALVGEF